MKPKFSGIIAASHTPMHPDGSLNLDAIPGQVEFLLKSGVNGLFVCGTTGEFPSLTIEERQATAKAFTLAVAGRVPVIIQVGHNCMSDAQALAAHAKEIGADGISAAPPSYFKPETLDMLIECCVQISQAAPELPFFYYHIPGMTGVQVSVVDLLRKATTQLPSLAGLKFSASTLEEFGRCLDAFPGQFSLMYGKDEMLLPALTVGATAAVGSTYNYAAPLFTQMWKAFSNGDLETARRCHVRVLQFSDIQTGFGGVRASKMMMKLVGVDCGPVRLPLRPPTEQEENALNEALTRIGFFDWRTGAREE